MQKSSRNPGMLATVLGCLLVRIRLLLLRLNSILQATSLIRVAHLWLGSVPHAQWPQYTGPNTTFSLMPLLMADVVQKKM